VFYEIVSGDSRLFFASPSRGGGSGMGFAGVGGVYSGATAYSQRKRWTSSLFCPLNGCRGSRSPFSCPFRWHHPIVAAFVLKEKAPIYVRIRAWVCITWQEWVFFSDSAGNRTDGAKFTARRTGCFGMSGVSNDKNAMTT
jgi:hypothetical protein